MFLNLKNGKATINTFRSPLAYVTEIEGIVNAMSMDTGEELTCTLFGYESALLEDGEYWSGSNATQEVLEELHSLIIESQEG